MCNAFHTAGLSFQLLHTTIAHKTNWKQENWKKLYLRRRRWSAWVRRANEDARKMTEWNWNFISFAWWCTEMERCRAVSLGVCVCMCIWLYSLHSFSGWLIVAQCSSRSSYNFLFATAQNTQFFRYSLSHSLPFFIIFFCYCYRLWFRCALLPFILAHRALYSRNYTSVEHWTHSHASSIYIFVL